MTRTVAVSFLLPGALVLACFEFTACSSSCPGPVVDGSCQAKCDDSLCVTGDVCVDNACRPACKSSGDCDTGQRCLALVSDSGKHGSYCVGPSSSASAGPKTGGACKSSSDCAESTGVRCVGGTCTFTCESHDDCVVCKSPGHCASAGSCTGTAKDAEGNAVRTCETDSFPRGPGQFGSHCPNGPASSDCDTANDFTCVGSAGDADAYCTKNFCGADADCPPGFFCETVETTAAPCADVCQFPGVGSGKCIASTDIGTGKRYQCGALSLLTTECRHREFCTPCDKDSDCLGVRNQVCAKDASGAKICTILCDDSFNSCPWGSAATCQTTDDALGAATCSHRFGSCHGTGKSCEPCVDERDCPSGYCAAEPFTNERFCVDLSATCACSGGAASCTGGGCPLTPPPANEPMTCIDGSALSGANGRCIGAASSSGCWPKL